MSWVSNLSAKWRLLSTNDRRTLQLMIAVILTALAYLGVVQPASERLALAEQAFSHARQLSYTLAATHAHQQASSTASTGGHLGRELAQAQDAGVELRNLSKDGASTQGSFAGPAQPLLRWIAGLEVRGAQIEALRLSHTADGQLEAVVRWRGDI